LRMTDAEPREAAQGRPKKLARRNGSHGG
jgi:hypothetical protein